MTFAPHPKVGCPKETAEGLEAWSFQPTPISIREGEGVELDTEFSRQQPI